MNRPPPAAAAPLQPLARELAQLVHSVTAQALRDAAGAADTTPRLRTPRPPVADAHSPGGAALAAAHPGGAADRREAQALYERCLQHYRQQVQPRLEAGSSTADATGAAGETAWDDVGIAAAFFVLANLGAYNDTDPDAATLPAVERQLRSLLARTTAWQQLDAAAKRSLFEQLALLGVLMNESRVAARQQGPAARANLAQAANAYLQTLLGLAPARLSATVQGLTVAEQLH